MEYLEAFESKGHRPKLLGKNPDYFEIVENHGGYQCAVCGWIECMHCIGENYDLIPSCESEQQLKLALNFSLARKDAEAEEKIRQAERVDCLRRAKRTSAVLPAIRRAILNEP